MRAKHSWKTWTKAFKLALLAGVVLVLAGCATGYAFVQPDVAGSGSYYTSTGADVGGGAYAYSGAGAYYPGVAGFGYYGGAWPYAGGGWYGGGYGASFGFGLGVAGGWGFPGYWGGAYSVAIPAWRCASWNCGRQHSFYQQHGRRHGWQGHAGPRQGAHRQHRRWRGAAGTPWPHANNTHAQRLRTGTYWGQQHQAVGSARPGWHGSRTAGQREAFAGGQGFVHAPVARAPQQRFESRVWRSQPRVASPTGRVFARPTSSFPRVAPGSRRTQTGASPAASTPRSARPAQRNAHDRVDRR